MQHHPGSWYMPWGMPLQKMLAVPLHPAVAAVGYHQSQAAAAAAAAAAANVPVPQVPPTHPQQQPQPQPPHHQSYPQHQMHPAAAMHQQLHHPVSAAAMFTPLSLRTFISPTPNHMSLGQQTLTNVAAVVAAQQQQQQSQSHQQQSQPQPQQVQHHQTSPHQKHHHHQSHHHLHHQSHPQTLQSSPNAHSLQTQNQSQLGAMNMNVGCVPMRQANVGNMSTAGGMMIPVQKVSLFFVQTKFQIKT